MTTFTVPGVKGKGRPRFARHGSHVTTYTPDSTVAYEQAVQLDARKIYTAGESHITVTVGTLDEITPAPVDWAIG